MLDDMKIRQIISNIKYKTGWAILFKKDGDRPYLQVSVDTRAEASLSPYTGKRMPWRGGKRFLSYHMCRQEVVGVCFDMFKAAEMHEIGEWFRYKGAGIYNPHLDPDVLAVVAKKKESFNIRQNAMSMVD